MHLLYEYYTMQVDALPFSSLLDRDMASNLELILKFKLVYPALFL
jgi:hypothetical protein